MKIAVAGIGYVGLSLAVLLARHHEVVSVDIDKQRVAMLERGESPIEDTEIKEQLHSGKLNLRATTDGVQAYSEADFVIVATPTNYDTEQNSFDTSSVETVLKLVRDCGSKAWVVIKSTIPVGFTEYIRQQMAMEQVLFSPEFLRESRALYDNLHPSRIIVGADAGNEKQKRAAETFMHVLQEAALEENVPSFLMGTTEAEAVKLFANTYLAMRVAYFNELDTYALSQGLDTRRIIEGVCSDPRIGQGYNNPSFGYGGYCLPKDSKQLLANFADLPESLMEAIVQSNRTRKDYLTRQVLLMAGCQEDENGDWVKGDKIPTIGIYRLIMKTGSDNFRQSAVQGIIKRLRGEGATVLIYEPGMPEGRTMYGNRVTHDLNELKEKSQVIVANRMKPELEDVREKVFTRDLFHRD